jgi:hypothetical protein
MAKNLPDHCAEPGSQPGSLKALGCSLHDNVREDFLAQPVKVVVIPCPAGYMLWYFGFFIYSFIYLYGGMFRRFL